MSDKPETYLITFEITTHSDPKEWDWDALLDGVDEGYTIHSIGQITKNNEEWGYYLTNGGLVCPECADNPLYAGELEAIEREGYPDGSSCDDCDALIGGEKDE